MASSSSSSSGGRFGEGAVATGTRDLKFASVGKSFEKLPPSLQKNINDGLKMSVAMRIDIANGRKHKIIDEWSTGKGNQKIKVITDVKNGKAVYTVKEKNKILKKDATKEQVANTVAQYYLKLLK